VEARRASKERGGGGERKRKFFLNDDVVLSPIGTRRLVQFLDGNKIRSPHGKFARAYQTLDECE